MGDALIELLPEGLSVERALDVGTGTGKVAGELIRKFPTSSLIALDISTPMLSRAKDALEGEPAFSAITFVTGDFEAFPFKDSSIDLVLSNLTYQWAQSPKEAFSELYRVLNPSGLILLSTLTSGTLEELKESVRLAGGKRPFMDFIEPGELRSSVESAGFELLSFDERACVREYVDMWELLSVLKNIGAANPTESSGDSLASGSFLREASRIYKSRFYFKARGEGMPGSVRATYKTVFLMAKKPHK